METLDHDSNHETPWHVHLSGQLYWLKRGIILIETENAQWPITPGSVGWIPAKLAHKAKVLAAVHGHILHFDSSDNMVLPEAPKIFRMDSLVQSLLQRATCLDGNHYPASYVTQLIGILGYEIQSMEELPVSLPLPVDRRARHIADELLRCPSTGMTQAQLANRWGVSVRTLSRIFINQTGLTFSQWRQQSKILISLQWVLDGFTISEVAERSGYSNVSAYIEAFRQRFGESPGKFQAKMSGIDRTHNSQE
ncbi:AraC family transcriptional regulator [Celerinatantimonas yamalensis]|uniref:Helix-turn-helix transcriptional regulator n=1 Tax=Celerinatantimonas yamalensis TaxID=559956 RepID=A0ABW9G6A4_9GAMM